MYRLIFIFVLISFASNSSASNQTLVFCSEGNPESLNPQRTLSGTARSATASTIYDRLVQFEHGSTKIIPSLAEHWDISEDNTKYTFYLRKDVHFHTTKFFTPTRLFNSDDVLFSINRQLDRSNHYHMVGGGTYQYFQGMGMHKLIKAVEKLDDHTIVVKLHRSEAPFLANMAMPFMSILSAEYADTLKTNKTESQLDIKAIGTGPYKLKRFVRGSNIRYQAHDKYWKGKANINNLLFSIVPDAAVRMQKMKKGECHISVYPSPTDLALIRENKTLHLEEAEGLNIGYLAMNIEKEPFNNPLVRKAISHALNKEAYLSTLFAGTGVAAINPYPEAMWSYTNDVEKYDYDVEKARTLLAKAGYQNGFKTTLWTLPVSRPYNPSGRKMGEMMKQDLAKIGIQVELSTFDWGTYLDKVKNGEHDIVQLGWTGDNGDPDNFLYTLFSCDSVKRGSNNSRYCKQDFDHLITEARTITNQSERKALYQDALKIFSQDVPIVPIVHAKVYRAVSNKVVGNVLDAFETDTFHHLTLR